MDDDKFRKLTSGLMGMGAWFAGNGPQYQQVQLAQEEQQRKARDMANLDDTRRMIAAGSRGDFNSPMQLLENRVENLKAKGGNWQHSEQSLALLKSNPSEWLRDQMIGEKTMSDALKVDSMFAGAKTGMASAKTHIYDNGTVLQSLPDGTTNVYGPGGELLEGEARRNALLTARNEQVTHRAAVAGAETEGRGNAERSQNIIEFGYDAAKGLPILKRGLALLDMVKTGGIDAASLKAKQWFGVESGDEAELAQNLGKAVLSQLKATFGSQFTAEEGKRLERLDAGIGKSTEGNRRILAQAMAMSEKYINNAIARAAQAGDYATVDELRELMSFELEAPGAKSASSEQAPSESRKNWTLMQDANGNQAYVGPNGEVEEVSGGL